MVTDWKAWVGTVLRVALAGVLGWAGLVKLVEPDGARDAIVAYRVFPASWVDLLGWALPIAEVALAVLLLVGLFTRIAAVLTALLMIGFIVGIASVWIRGYSIDCGCFGGGGDVSEDGKTWRYLSEILRDVVFTLMALWLIVWPRTVASLDDALFARRPVLYDDGFDELDGLDVGDPTDLGAPGAVAPPTDGPPAEHLPTPGVGSEGNSTR